MKIGKNVMRGLNNRWNNQKGITGLETAIVLIAFVVVSSVFAFAALSTGMFSSDKARETVIAGLAQTRATMELKGSVIGTANGVGSGVTAALTTTAAVLAASIGGVAAFVQRRRRAVRQTATTAERRSVVGATAVVAGLLVLSGVLHIASLETVGADDSAGAIAVGMKDTRFHPTEVVVQAGQPAMLVVKNSDLVAHTFTVEGLGINEVIIGGSEKLIAIAASSPGSFAYVCEFFGHEEMKGTIVVQAAPQ